MEGGNGEHWNGAPDEEPELGGGPIAVVWTPGHFTTEQYDETVRELERRGLGDPDGRLLHVSYEVDGTLHTLDVWESEEAFLGEFGQNLADWWRRQGRHPGHPEVHPVHRVMLGAAGAARHPRDGDQS